MLIYAFLERNSSNFSFACFSATRALSNSSLSVFASAARLSDSSTSRAVNCSASRVFRSRLTFSSSVYKLNIIQFLLKIFERKNKTYIYTLSAVKRN